MIHKPLHFIVALLVALLFHGGLMAWYQLPEEKALPTTSVPLRLSLLAPLEEVEAAVPVAPLPVVPIEAAPVLQEIKPEPVPEPLPVTLPEPEVLLPEPEVLSEAKPLAQEPVPEMWSEPLPEPETVLSEVRPVPEVEAVPEPQMLVAEMSPEIEALAQEPEPETWLESPLEFAEPLPEVIPEEIPPKMKAPEQTVSPALPETQVSEVSDTPPQNAAITAAYKKLLTAWLEKHKYYPRRAKRLRIEGEGWLRIRIDRAGRTQDVRLERTTGNRLLDQAALEIARRADPFPAMPQSDLNRELEFIVPVAFMLR